MKITCKNCQTNYRIDDSKIKTKQTTTRCPKCRHVQKNESDKVPSLSIELKQDIEEVNKQIKKQNLNKDIKSDKNLKPNIENDKGAMKLLFISLVVLFIAILLSVALFLFARYSNKDVNELQNKRNLIIKKYIKLWEKTIITTPRSIEKLYNEAKNNLYKNKELLYPISTSQFREIFLKDKNNFNFLYYSIISETISTDVYVDEKKLKKYLDDLKLLEESEKNNYIINIAFSSIYFRLNEFINSYNYSQKAKKLNPNSYFALFLEARFYVKNNKIKKAVSTLKKAIKINPQLNIARELLAKTFIENSLFKEGIKYYAKENNNLAKHSLAELYIKLGMFKKALYILKKLDEPRSVILYSKMLYQLFGNNISSLKLLENVEKNELVKLSKYDKIELYSNLINLYYLKNDKIKFSKSAHKLKNIDKNSKFYNFSMALLQIKEYNFKGAEFFISKLKKDLKSYNIIQKEYYFAKKNYNEAFKYAKKLVENHPYEIKHWFDKILIAIKMDNLELINTTITNLAKRVDPNFYIRNKDYFEYFKFNKNYSKVQSYFQEKINSKDEPNKELLYKDLAIFEFYINNYKNSLTFFNESNKIEPNNYTNYLYLGNIYFIRKNFQEAIKNAELSIRLNKFDIFSYFLIVRSYLGLKDIKLAKKYYEEAINTDKSQYLNLMNILILVHEKKYEKAKKLLKNVGPVFENDYLVNKLRYKL